MFFYEDQVRRPEVIKSVIHLFLSKEYQCLIFLITTIVHAVHGTRLKETGVYLIISES